MLTTTIYDDEWQRAPVEQRKHCLHIVSRGHFPTFGSPDLLRILISLEHEAAFKDERRLKVQVAIYFIMLSIIQ